MSEQIPPCKKCDSPYPYQDGPLWVCPECSHEWTQEESAAAELDGKFFDVNGNELQDGDSVTVIKDLKVSGSSTVKVGTKVKKIRLLSDGPDGHDIACKIDGFGSIYLKTKFVKKSK